MSAATSRDVHDADTDPSAGEDFDEEALRRTGDRVERLLGELRASAGPMVWARIEELVSSLTTIYGQGLARTLEAFAEGGGIDDATRARLCADPVVESLLLLHGLHPAPLEERITAAVERVRRVVGVGRGQIEASAVDAAGRLRLRLSGDWRESPVPEAGVEAALRRAIEEAAPELTELDVSRDGVVSNPARGLVQIDLTRSRAARSTGAGP